MFFLSGLSDGDSSLSDDSCSEDRNSSHQRRELGEGQSSRTGELSAPVEQRSYNLRPRKVDSVIMQRRSEFARSREQQNQRRNKRKESESLRQKEVNEYVQYACNKIRKIMDGLPKPRDKDLENRTEIIIADSNAKIGRGVWRPYFEASDIGLFKTTLKGVSWAVEKLALQAAPSVVGLQSYTGGTYLFTCSGTIVEFFEESSMIVTVANLIKCSDADEVASSLKICVYLNNHETVNGFLAYHDFYHNICVIRILSTVLPEKRFSSNMEAVKFDKSCSRDVVTLGRDKETHGLLVATGKVIPKNTKFDCEELFVSTCKISKVEVGGPLMDFDGNFIGMNYYHAKETPFIPGFIVNKCLQQFKLFGKVVRPSHGLRVRTLHAEGHIALENMQTNFRGVTGVIIEKIEEQSSAKSAGLNVGDIINQVDGVYFSNAAELGGILLDIGTTFVMYNLNNMQLKLGLSGYKREMTIVIDGAVSCGLDRWPFPKPIIVRTYVDGKIEDEEWYALESSRDDSRESSPTGSGSSSPTGSGSSSPTGSGSSR